MVTNNVIGTWIAQRNIEFKDLSVSAGEEFNVVEKLGNGEVKIRKDQIETTTKLSLLQVTAEKK